jgi:predicted enzyme related to lactoylglutathione lyase
MRFDPIAAGVVRGQRSDRQERFLFRCESDGRSRDLAGDRHLLSIYRKPSRTRFPYTAAMPNNIGRFAINADDVPRARDFYQRVFGWMFEPWGPPNFYLIETGHEQVRAVGGLLQERRELVPNSRMIGFECTIGVQDIDETIRAIESNGGKMVTEKFLIPNVVTVAYFQDTEGNVAGISEAVKK